MKKTIFLFALVFLLFSNLSALNIEVNTNKEIPVLVAEVGNEIHYNISIKNNGPTDTINLYNLLGFEMSPREKMQIQSGETKNISVTLKPIGKVKERGFYTITYYIRGQSDTVEKTLTMNVLELKDCFDIGTSDLVVEGNSLKIFITNKIDLDFKNLKIHLSSPFFNVEKEIDLNAKEKKEFEIALNPENFRKLIAGFYTLKGEIIYQNHKANLEESIKFVEKDFIETTQDKKGFIIKQEIIKKENKGNVVSGAHAVVEKNIISRLFTTFEPKPVSVDRSGWNVYYSWNTKLNPGETININVKTNWLYPLLIIILVIAIVIMAKRYSYNDVVIKKKTQFVRAKGGEFGLKVSVIVQANKYVENINVIDRLPSIVKLYDKFGTEQPSKVDEKARKIEWNFDKLDVGEKRIMTYLIYSRLGVVGKFALPRAVAIYQREGEIKETNSNRTFFITDQTKAQED